uniref:Uncharacterized protein n=1 Tax=Arundo donax TaxID=35708 RepID=A0A0A9GGD4_ARUDO
MRSNFCVNYSFKSTFLGNLDGSFN